MVKSWKNHVVHVHPNRTPPIRRIMLCVAFHVQEAVAYKMQHSITSIIRIVLGWLRKISYIYITAVNTQTHLVLERERSPKSVHKMLRFDIRSNCFSRIHDSCVIGKILTCTQIKTIKRDKWEERENLLSHEAMNKLKKNKNWKPLSLIRLYDLQMGWSSSWTGKSSHSQYEELVSIQGFLILPVQALELHNCVLHSFLSSLTGPGTSTPTSNITRLIENIFLQLLNS